MAPKKLVMLECSSCGSRPTRFDLLTEDHKPGDQCPCCFLDDYDCDGTLVEVQESQDKRFYRILIEDGTSLGRWKKGDVGEALPNENSKYDVYLDLGDIQTLSSPLPIMAPILSLMERKFYFHKDEVQEVSVCPTCNTSKKPCPTCNASGWIPRADGYVLNRLDKSKDLITELPHAFLKLLQQYTDWLEHDLVDPGTPVESEMTLTVNFDSGRSFSTRLARRKKPDPN